MDIHITGRHIKITPSIRGYVTEKVEKAQKYFDHIIGAQVVLFIEKRAHKAEILIQAKRHKFRAIAAAADLYSAVDLASDKIDAQLKKHKERLKDHHKPLPEPFAPETLSPGTISFTVIKRPVAPMSPDEAAEQMESLGRAFHLYQDRQSGQVQVVYRRSDESYAILQPVKKGGR